MKFSLTDFVIVVNELFKAFVIFLAHNAYTNANVNII